MIERLSWFNTRNLEWSHWRQDQVFGTSLPHACRPQSIVQSRNVYGRRCRAVEDELYVVSVESMRIASASIFREEQAGLGTKV